MTRSLALKVVLASLVRVPSQVPATFVTRGGWRRGIGWAGLVSARSEGDGKRGQVHDVFHVSLVLCDASIFE